MNPQFTKKVIFSQSYTTSSNISAGQLSQENFISQRDIDKFAPFDTLIALNSDSVRLSILQDMNPQNKIPLSANNGAVSGDSLKFSQFSIKNEDSVNAHTAGTINILVQKTIFVPVTDIIQEQKLKL